MSPKGSAAASIGSCGGDCSRWDFTRRGEATRNSVAARLQMPRNQLAESVILAEADIHEPLHQVHVRTAVSLDEQRTFLIDCDVPADDHPAAKDLMRADGECLHRIPMR